MKYFAFHASFKEVPYLYDEAKLNEIQPNE